MAIGKNAEAPIAGEDQREAERIELALRPAKLVCQSGEYACQMRDVSTLGVGLAFLHDVPPEPRMILQLASGHTYPVERVWIGKRQAGFRFAADVSLAEFLDDDGAQDAAPLKLKLVAPAQVIDGRNQIFATISEMGCEEVRIKSAEPLAFNRLLAFEIDGLTRQLGEVRWKDGDHYGLQFQHPLALQELARCALHHQPFGTSFPSGFAGLLSAARAA